VEPIRAHNYLAVAVAAGTGTVTVIVNLFAMAVVIAGETANNSSFESRIYFPSTEAL